MTHSASPVSRLWQLAHADRADVTTLFVYASVVGLATLFIPVTVQALVGSVAFGTLLQPILVLSLLLLGGLTLSATIRVLETWVIERLQQRVFVRTAVDFAARLTNASSGATGVEHRPELLNRFFDVVTVQKSASILLADGLAVMLQTVIALLALALYHPWLLGFGVLLALALAFVCFGLGRGAVRTAIDESAAKYEIAAWLEELARHPNLFRGAGARLATARAEQQVSRWIDARRGHFRIFLRQTIGLVALQVLSSVGLLLVGGILVINRQLTLGQLVAAELIVSAVASGIGKLGKTLDATYDLAAACDKLAHVEHALPGELVGGVEPAGCAGGARVSIRDVSLSTPRGLLLQRLALDVAPGERIGIVGASGTGRSALLDLVYGAWDGPPPGGIVELDEVDLRSWCRESLGQHVALVRSGALFAGSLVENISLGRPGIGAVEAQRALEAVGVWSALAAHPDGLEQRLRADGAPLPTGTAWRVILARALVAKPRLLLIDGLGDLDGEARATVLSLLHDRSRPMSMVLASGDRAHLERCDRVYELADGRIALAGRIA